MLRTLKPTESRCTKPEIIGSQRYLGRLPVSTNPIRQIVRQNASRTHIGFDPTVALS